MYSAQRIKMFIIAALIMLAPLSLSRCDDDLDNLITREQRINNNKETPDIPSIGTGTWTMHADAGVSRRGAAFAVKDGWAYVHGGANSFGVADELWRFSLSSGEVELIDAGTALASHGMAFVGDVLYVFGGRDSGGAPARTFLFYDFSIQGESGWTGTIEVSDTNGPFPGARYGHSVLGSDDYLYVYGGTDDIAWDAALYRFDPNDTPKPRWSKVSLDGPEVAGHGSALDGDMLYVFGGLHDDSEETAYRDVLSAYSFSAGEWNSISVLSSGPRAWIGLALADSSLYTCFGLNSGGLLKDSWMYSPATGWSALNEGPAPRAEYCLGSAAGAVVLYGGYDPSSGRYYSDIWVFSLDE